MTRIPTDLRPKLTGMPKEPANIPATNKALAIQLRRLAAEISASPQAWYMAQHEHIAQVAQFGARPAGQVVQEHEHRRGRSFILTPMPTLIPKFPDFARQG